MAQRQHYNRRLWLKTWNRVFPIDFPLAQKWRPTCMQHCTGTSCYICEIVDNKVLDCDKHRWKGVLEWVEEGPWHYSCERRDTIGRKPEIEKLKCNRIWKPTIIIMVHCTSDEFGHHCSLLLGKKCLFSDIFIQIMCNTPINLTVSNFSCCSWSHGFKEPDHDVNREVALLRSLINWNTYSFTMYLQYFQNKYRVTECGITTLYIQAKCKMRKSRSAK